jgi:D-serine deaminase-like pyridoxal phosphate-dependent protein
LLALEAAADPAALEGDVSFPLAVVDLDALEAEAADLEAEAADLEAERAALRNQR